MANRVAIAGIAQSKYVGNNTDALSDMIFEVTAKALEDAHIDIKDIECVTLAAHDMLDGRAITTMLTAAPAGAYRKDEIRVADDGAFAFALAYLRILSGHFTNSLVVSWSKCSECVEDTIHTVANLSYDPFFYRPFALNDVTSYAIQAQKYMLKYSVTEEQAAMVVVKNRGNAANNGLAHLQSKVTMEEVIKSDAVSYPLKKLDLPPWSDGACAVVLAKDTLIKKLNKKCAWVKGISWANDTYYSGDKDLIKLESLSIAAKKAYKMAGISNPSKEIDVAEIHDITSFHELMEYEALGFCSEGMGGRYIESGATKFKGGLPVNPSGGCLSSNPYTAVGLVRVAEAALQVMGQAGEHQISGVKTALAHGISGLGAQSNCVMILSNNS